MRVGLRGVARAGDSFSFTYNGRAVYAYPGESVACALLAAGEAACRRTSRGEERGLFCGMGVCGECTVLVDGQARRSCMEKAAPGLRVETQPARRALPDAAIHPPLTAWRVREVELLVIGAGPGGLAAACAAARAGVAVLVVDERLQAGGQYFKQPGEGFTVREEQLDAQFRQGRAMYQDAVAAGARFLFATTVWGVFPGPELAVVSGDTNLLLRPRRIVLSPGAFERPRPFPGWTLPGVMTTGAAQTLLRAYQVSPGRRVVVAGNGPLNLQVGRELADAGAEVAAVAELAPGLIPDRLVCAMRMGLLAPDLLLAGLGHRLRLWRRRVPLWHSTAVIRAEGAERLEGVTLARVDAHGAAVPGTERRVDCDALCLGYGFLPQSELARALEGVTRVTTVVDAMQGHESSASAEVLAVLIGDAGGLGGARVAIAQGELAGLAVARHLGRAPARKDAAALRALRRHRAFQRALWSYYAAPASSLAAADAATIVCRCESVTLGELQALREQGVGSVGALKRESRAGMGRCQGRYCGALLRESMGLADTDDGANFAPRPPFKPLTLAQLAAPVEAALDFDRTAGMRDDEAPAEQTERAG